MAKKSYSIILEFALVVLLLWGCNTAVEKKESASKKYEDKDLIDSLETALKSQPDSLKLSTYLQLADGYLVINARKSIDIAMHAASMALLSDNIDKLSEAYRCVGRGYYMIDNLDSSLVMYRKAQNCYTNLPATTFANVLNSYIGDTYKYKKAYDSALMYYDKAKLVASLLTDTNKLIIAYTRKAQVYEKMLDSAKCMAQFNLALELAKEAGKVDKEADIYNDIAYFYSRRDDYNASIVYCEKSIKKAKQVNDLDLVVSNLDKLGNIYYLIEDFFKAVEVLKESINISEKRNDRPALASSHKALADVYYEQHEYEKALKYYMSAMEITMEQENRDDLNSIASGIGDVYRELGQFDSAFTYYELSIKKSEEQNDLSTKAFSLEGIGKIYFKQKKYDKAYDYIYDAHKIALTEEDDIRLGEGQYWLARVNFEKGNYAEAARYALNSYRVGETSELLYLEKMASEILYQCYEKLGKIDQSFIYFKRFKGISDSIANKDNSKKILQLEVEEKSAMEHEEQKRKDELANIEKKRQQQITLLIALGFLVVALFSVKVYRQSQKQKETNRVLGIQQDEISVQNSQLLEKNEELNQQNEEIAAQRDEIENQNLMLSSQHKDITDSIRYASRIQGAILVPFQEVQRMLPESFILYKPKDILSGDFYWVDKKGDDVFMAAVDCTGHGVPGALMSIVGFNLFKHAVNEHQKTSPNLILDQVNKDLSDTLRQTFHESKLKDGMDVALCKINMKTLTLDYAGAYNPLYLVRNKELIIQKADKFPVGIFMGESLKNFTNNHFQLQKGDCIYIFSDGYADQFGGEHGKKFMYKRFEQMLVDISELPMYVQKETLENTLKDWQRHYKQVDDILVIGVKV